MADRLRAWKTLPWGRILKKLLYDILVPFLLLLLLTQPIRIAVRSSDAAVFWVLLAALGIVCLNWYLYAVLRRKRPPLPVFTYGTFLLLIVVVIEHLALPAENNLTTTLATVGGFLLMVFMLLLSFWFASLPYRPARIACLVLRALIGILLAFLVYQTFRDFESRTVTLDTWIYLGILALMLLGFNARKFSAAYRRSAFRRQAAGLTEGRIVQIVGITHLDREDDLITRQRARIHYAVNGVSYEIRAKITRYALYKFGRKAFVGQEVPVHYDPADPSHAYAEKIDRRFFDQTQEEQAP